MNSLLDRQAKVICAGVAALCLAGFPSAGAAEVPSGDFESTAQRVQMLYGSEQFAALEKALDELLASDARFASGASVATAAYWAFRRQMPAPGAKPEELERIKRWKAEVPGSRHAAFAEARYWYSIAWNQRGASPASGVKDAAWIAFQRDLDRAESSLSSAPAASRESPLAQNLLLAITQDSGEPKTRPDDVVEGAMARWPRYYDFLEVRLTRLVPKWGGSGQAVEEFISRWSTRQGESEGDSLYARLYIFMESQGIPPAVSAVNWTRLKSSFRDLVGRYPDPRFRNLFASYSCRVRDAAQFREALNALKPGELNPGQWLPDASYESCQGLK